MLSRTKKIAGKLHLWLGLASGLVIFIVALTGSILVFEKEMDEWLNQDFYFTQMPATPHRLALDSLVKNVKAFDPALQIKEIEVDQASASRTVLISGDKKKQTFTVAVNPYTGKVIRAINHNNRFFTIVLRLHRSLLADKAGKIITGASCFIFLILIISGLILWWPKRLRNLKQRLKIKWNGSAKRLNWDVHSVLGFYAYLVLLAIALTGLILSYQWANNSLFVLLDGKPSKRLEAPPNKIQQPIAYGFYEQIFQEANKQMPYKGKVSLLLPKKDNLAVTVSKENREAKATRVVDYLYFEKGTGTLLLKRFYKDQSKGFKARRLVYPIHTGQIFGLPTKILAFASALIAISLPITGFRVWLGRRKKKTTPKKVYRATVLAKE